MDSDKIIRKIVAVTFADIKGYTAITGVNESKAFEAVKKFRKIVENSVEFYSGEIVQYFGDGVLIIHNSVIDSIHCAIKMQQAFQIEPKIPVKIGIHFGDILMLNDNVYGDAVNIASRMQELAEEESVIVSDKVVNEIENHPEIKATFISEEYIKNVTHKIGIYAINHHGLKIPTEEFVHKKAFKPKKPRDSIFKVFGFLLILAVLIAIFNMAGGRFNITPNVSDSDKLDVRVLSVFPFKNFTGDSTLSELGSIAAYKLISSLKVSENIILVDYANVSDKKKIQEFKFFNAKPFTSNTGASHVINGEVYLSNDTLVYHSRLQSLEHNMILHEFQSITCSKENKLVGIDDIANQIKGFLAVQESNRDFLRNPTYDAYKHSVIGWDFYNEGDTGLAFKSFEKSIESDSSFLDPYLSLLDIYYYRKKYKEANTLYERIIKKFPPESLSERERNMLKYDQALISGNNRDAFKAFKTEYVYNPYYLENNTTHIIHCRLLINNPDKALEVLKSPKISEIDYTADDLNYHVYRLNIGIWAYVLNAQLDKAKELIKYYPSKVNNRDVFESQLLLHTTLGDTVAINETLFNADISGFNKSNYLHYWVVHLFALQGKSHLRNIYAERALEKYLSENPRSYFIGYLYIFQEEFKKALQFFDDYLTRRPKSRIALAMKGVCYAKLGDPKNAEACINGLENLKKEYDRGFISYYQAVIYNLIGEKEKAIKLIAMSINEGKYFDNLVFDFDPFLEDLKTDPRYQLVIHPKPL